jgi:hypothetical protein
MGWKQEERIATIYLNNQPIELQALVTECIVETNDLPAAMKLFDRKKQKFIERYRGEQCE